MPGTFTPGLESSKVPMDEWRSAQSSGHLAPRFPTNREQSFEDCAPEFPVYQGKYREFFNFGDLAGAIRHKIAI